MGDVVKMPQPNLEANQRRNMLALAQRAVICKFAERLAGFKRPPGVYRDLINSTNLARVDEMFEGAIHRLLHRREVDAHRLRGIWNMETAQMTVCDPLWPDNPREVGTEVHTEALIWFVAYEKEFEDFYSA